MPKRPATPCNMPGCPELSHNRYCPQHSRQYEKQRGTPAERGYDGNWQKLRKMKLAADPLCETCLETDLVVIANEVDHIIPKEQGGTDEWDNLQSLCKSCHSKKTAKEKGTRCYGMPTVSVVCGPPGSGKSSYVKKHSTPGDLIVDLDLIWQAFTGMPAYDKPEGLLPFVLAARDAVLRQLKQPSNIYRAWIIAGAPKPEQRQEYIDKYKARVILLDVDKSTCMYRIGQDKRRKERLDSWESIVDRWYKNYKPAGSDVVVRG